MKLVIGLVGEIGSGKGTLFTLLKDQVPTLAVVRIGFSDIIRETLVLWELPNTRENLQKLPQAMDQFYGAGSLSYAIKKRIDSKKEDIVILDGIRWQTDVAMLRNFPKNILVYITARPETRFSRLCARSQNFDDATLCWETFLEQELAPNEIQIRQIGSQADYKIENIGDLDRYREQVKLFFETRISQTMGGEK